MDHSVHEQGSRTQQDQNRRGYWTNLPILGDLVKLITDLFHWTDEEWEEAGIYIDRLGDE
jgi:hypothetical protein